MSCSQSSARSLSNPGTYPPVYLASCSKYHNKPGPVASVVNKVTLSCQGWPVSPGPRPHWLGLRVCPHWGVSQQKFFCILLHSSESPQLPHQKAGFSIFTNMEMMTIEDKQSRAQKGQVNERTRMWSELRLCLSPVVRLPSEVLGLEVHPDVV